MVMANNSLKAKPTFENLTLTVSKASSDNLSTAQKWGNVVQVSIFVRYTTATNSGTYLFQLPEGARPSNDVYTALMDVSNSQGKVAKVSTSGYIYLTSNLPASSWLEGGFTFLIP